MWTNKTKKHIFAYNAYWSTTAPTVSKSAHHAKLISISRTNNKQRGNNCVCERKSVRFSSLSSALIKGEARDFPRSEETFENKYIFNLFRNWKFYLLGKIVFSTSIKTFLRSANAKLNVILASLRISIKWDLQKVEHLFCLLLLLRRMMMTHAHTRNPRIHQTGQSQFLFFRFRRKKQMDWKEKGNGTHQKKKKRRLFVRIQQKKDWMSSCSEFRILKHFCRHLLEVLPRFRRHIAKENCPVCPSVFLSSRREKKFSVARGGEKEKEKGKQHFLPFFFGQTSRTAGLIAQSRLAFKLNSSFFLLFCFCGKCWRARTDVFRTFGICTTTCTKNDQKPVTIPCIKAKLSRNLELLFRFSIEVE